METIGIPNGPRPRPVLAHPSMHSGRELGLYIHIPFCLQRCRYCDFATYSTDEIPVNDEYIDALMRELELRRPLFQEQTLRTIYFGGGTPSLLSETQFHRILTKIRSLGFIWRSNIEITVEVNPATLTLEKCRAWADLGINRVSVGAQTFSDPLLATCGRKHNSEDTRQTLALVQKFFPNYSLDLLFALPGQNLTGLERDLSEIRDMNPPHVSAYCLTLQEGHPMNVGRPPEGTQIDMFQMVSESLLAMGLPCYEISNFARPGHESQHNLIYWQDRSYWGVGLSSHSYRRDSRGRYRFWNSSTYKSYMAEMKNLKAESEIEQSFAMKQYERLKPWEALTDYCHTQLRLTRGLRWVDLKETFPFAQPLVEARLGKLLASGWVELSDEGFALNFSGKLLSNQAFSELLFSAQDIDNLETATILTGREVNHD